MSSNYLNRQLITKVKQLKEMAEAGGMHLAQNNSNHSGNYLSAVRLYRNRQDFGHPDRAVWEGRNEEDIDALLSNKLDL
jgi:hypothetical protein